MEALLGISVVFGLLIGYASLCNWLFRVALRPLQVPDRFLLESKRERTLTFIIFLSLPLNYLGLPVLLSIYARGIYLHFSERREFGNRVRNLPWIPRMALSELLVMVFSLALFPLVISAFIQCVNGAVHSNPNEAQGVKIASFIVGTLIFPLCFITAYHRLDGNRVTLGRTRLMLLFLYPYMTFAIHAVIVGTVLLMIFLFEGMSYTQRGFQNDRWISRISITAMVFLFGAAFLAAGTWLARMARLEADERTG